jgi:hypothetical protein
MMAMIWVFCLEITALISYVLITRSAYPTSVLFYVTLIRGSFAPSELHFVLTPQVRLHYLVKGIQQLVLIDPFFSVPVLLVAAIFMTRKRRNTGSVMIAVASLVSSAILYAVFPHFEGRYYISLLVFIPLLIFLCCADPIDSSLMPSGREMESSRTRTWGEVSSAAHPRVGHPLRNFGSRETEEKRDFSLRRLRSE